MWLPLETDLTQASGDIVTDKADVLSIYLSFIGPFARVNPTGETHCDHRPIANTKDGIPAFSKQIVGCLKFKGLMRKIAYQGCLKGNFTTHSVKASLTTQLFEHCRDEQLIHERTSHCSVQGLCKYKCTTSTLQQAVSTTLQDSMPKWAKPNKKR